ncbi:hypothetical protein [Paenibacillus sp. sgz500958]|uniref:hypothetical protein n=1 Tax=Paenibacillus sp. sgz500958 TaxID=3242475 RepID=UPI0036D432EF
MKINVFKQNNIEQKVSTILNRNLQEVPSLETKERIQQIEIGIAAIKDDNLQIHDSAAVHKAEDNGIIQSVLFKSHHADYIDHIRTSSDTIREGELVIDSSIAEPGVDQDTPLTAGIYDSAIAAFGTAVKAAIELGNAPGSVNYALCRPPGHHAGPAWAGGYCYFNNAVGAALALQERGHGRVGLLDLDFHYGNGSAAILQEKPDIFYGSIHGNTIDNFPFQPTEPLGPQQVLISYQDTPTEREYLESLVQLLSKAMGFGCTALVISMGYDIIQGDHHGTWDLPTSIYLEVGKLLEEASVPICIVQEGGYFTDKLSECSRNLIQGINKSHNERMSRVESYQIR